MGVLCPYCDKKPEGYKSSGSLGGHVRFKHPEKQEEYKQNLASLTYIKSNKQSTVQKDTKDSDIDTTSNKIDFSEWDDDDYDEYVEQDAEINLLKQKAKAARLKAKIARYNFEANNPGQAMQLQNQPAQAPSMNNPIEIIRLVKEMQSTGNELNINKLKDMIDFAREFTPESNSGSDDNMMNMLLPLLLQGKGASNFLPVAGSAPNLVTPATSPLLPLPGETNVDYEKRLRGELSAVNAAPETAEELLEAARRNAKKKPDKPAKK